MATRRRPAKKKSPRTLAAVRATAAPRRLADAQKKMAEQADQQRELEDQSNRALLDAEWARQDRRAASDTTAWQRAVWPAAAGEPAPAVPATRRGGKVKLTDAAWREHLRRHPLGTLGPNGKPLGAPTRVRLLKAEQGIIASRPTVTRRLKTARG